MLKKKVYQEIASRLNAIENCEKRENWEWRDKHEEAIREIARNHLPSGSGIDTGTRIDFDKSNPEKIVLLMSYHHMNENGMYDGWTDHTITVRPSLQFGFNLTISGRNRNDLKDYLHEVYEHALNREIDIQTGKLVEPE